MQNFIDINNFDGQIFHNVEMSKYTTYKIGGPAKCFVEVNNLTALMQILDICKTNNFEWFILGGGSNLLISDSGFDGIIIKLGGDFNSLKYEDNLCICGAAVSSAKFLNFCMDNNFAGAQFLAGIPGSIGGAIKMNAGRKEDWISNIIKELTIVDSDGNVITINANDINWGYRCSDINDDKIIISAKFELEKVNDEEIEIIRKEISEFNESRRQSQDLSLPSCGSVFKNPKDQSAGKLIEDAGLKGKSIGGAEISQKHANFIVNKNKASANDVVQLINLIQNEIYNKYNIKLQPELKFLGFSNPVSLF